MLAILESKYSQDVNPDIDATATRLEWFLKHIVGLSEKVPTRSGM